MTKTFRTKTGLLISLFAFLVLLNWVYVLWVKNLFEDLATAWFVLTPLFGYFYFTFAVMSLIFMYQRKRLGLSLGCFVLLFGSILAMMSYAAVLKISDIYQLLVVPLIVLDALVMLFIVSFYKVFKN